MPNTWSRKFGALIKPSEKGERQANSKMIPVIAELFELDFKELQIRYLSQKLNDEFGKEPFFDEVLNILNKKTKRNSLKKDQGVNPNKGN